MALSLGTLTAYTQQNIKPLLSSAVFGATTQKMIMDGGIVIPNVKSSVTIPLLDTDAVFATDACSFDPSGTTTFTQRTISVGKIKLEEKICPKDLEAYFTQQALKSGSTYEDFGNPDFQKVYLDKKNAKQADQSISREREINKQTSDQAKLELKRQEILSKERIAQKELQVAQTNKNKYDQK